MVDNSQTTRRTALVVDDVGSVRFYHASILKAIGFECVMAKDGAEGIDRLRQGGIDLVVLDIVMPNLDGNGFIAQLRGLPEFALLPILVISSEPVGDNIRRAGTAEFGPIGFAQKPLFPADIIRETTMLMAESGRR